ncbi:MAG: rhodanese-like domain-containing protein [Bacteroidetes bacterium]|nr:rhodanese-like domain-containing protein [Bacteroidota bacterium]
MKIHLFIYIFAFIILSCDHKESQQSGAFIQNVNAEKFKELIEAGKGITLDVRTPEEVLEGYIGTAIAINIYDEDFEQKINFLAKDEEIYVYCKVGGRSSKAAEILLENGFKKVYHLENGIVEWKEKGLPLSFPK